MNENDTSVKMRRRITLLLGNALLVIVILLLCLQHVKQHRARETAAAEDAFVSSVSSMSSVATTVLSALQFSCSEKAAYITASAMDMEDALRFLADSNSDPAFMAHILDYDTLQGFSCTPDESGNTAVDYSSLRESIREAMQAVRGEASEAGSENASSDLSADSIHLTSAYTNPISHFQSVGFLEDIVLTDEDGAAVHALLVQVVPTSEILSRWTFPSQYAGAEMALLSASGDYIIHPNSMKSQNFWEFIRIYNSIGYDEADRIREQLTGGAGKIMKLSDSTGTPCYVVCRPFAEGRTDMYFAAMIPVDALSLAGVDYTLVIIVAVGMLLILMLNSFYILDMNRRLRRSNELALEASRAKTDFLSSMSHDIRTPMNAIIGLTTIASRNTNDPAHVSDCLTKISTASNHLLTLINDILDISKIESGKLSLNPAPFSLDDLISQDLSIVQPQVRAKNQELEVHLDGVEHERLYADELRIKQIFINLLSNAVKYTEPGGRITVGLKEQSDETAPDQIRLTYTVQDNGIGMSPEFMKIMYEPFSRVEDSRRSQTQGTGLGLAITRQMVDLMGGTIDCESTPGEGTTFTVTLTLPLAEDSPDTADLALPGVSLLLIDDDETFRSTSLDTFRSLEMQADTAASVSEALTMLEERKELGLSYDVILLDWKLRGTEGAENLRTVREAAGAQVPILVVSAYDWDEIKEPAKEAGATDFLGKPLFRTSLCNKLRTVLHTEGPAPETETNDIARGLRGLHLLVAEDNDMNWEIIRELLSMYDLTADRAENGSLAVSRLKEAPDGTYTAVLMDVQMPVMNGYEATAAIRQLEDEKKRTIPIIAMTADAFAEDIQACLDAGMNAHTSKPVDMNKLFDTLRNVLAVK